MHQVFVSESGRFDIQVKEQFLTLQAQCHKARYGSDGKRSQSCCAKSCAPCNAVQSWRDSVCKHRQAAGRKKSWKCARHEKPKLLNHARRGKPDDLKLISGLGPVLGQTLNELGVYHFDQIANWDAAHLSWIEEHWGCGAKVKRDNWVAQAKKLAK